MRALALFSIVAASILAGCVGVPSPLVPGLRGTIGVPHSGTQTDAVELPGRGPGYVRYRPLGSRYWGVSRLVTAISAAAEHVTLRAPGGAPLVVGDLSAKSGGKIQGHNSHRSGRDVDLLYYVTTPLGAPITSPGFVRIDADGLGFVPETGEYVRFDVVRQWELLKSLVENPEIGVQFMFMSRALEALVIDYALARGEPLELIHRVQTVLLEPTDSLPHDDHLHLRIACAPEEGVSGCNGGGPYWDWLPEPPVALPVDSESLAEIAADDPWISVESVAHTASASSGGA
jgi:penicillin-insensitive murein endopeptidase